MTTDNLNFTLDNLEDFETVCGFVDNNTYIAEQEKIVQDRVHDTLIKKKLNLLHSYQIYITHLLRDFHIMLNDNTIEINKKHEIVDHIYSNTLNLVNIDINFLNNYRVQLMNCVRAKQPIPYLAKNLQYTISQQNGVKLANPEY